MATVDLTADTFQATVDAEGIVLVDCWASWCAPCRMFAPVFLKASEKHPDITFAKLDTEAEPMLSRRLQISAIPTLMIYRDGVLLFADAGALPGPALEDLIGQARALDMDEVRRKVAEQPATR